MEIALKMTKSSKVDYINARGTSTPAGDITELNAINLVFGEDLPIISSTKFSGHSLGAAEFMNQFFSLIMMKEGFVVGSANIENLDEGAADFPIVRENTKKELNKILSNSFGFGGTNATLLRKGLKGISSSVIPLSGIFITHILIHIFIIVTC